MVLDIAKRFSRAVPALVIAAALFAQPLAAHAAGNTVTAESLFGAGQEAMKAGDYKKACDNFAASQKADASVGTLLNLALCNEKQGNLASAWATYKEASSLAKQKGDNERDQIATDHANELQPKLSKLTITAKAATVGMVVTRDGVDIGEGSLGVPLPIDPGPHTIEVTAKGFKTFTKKVEIGKQADLQSLELPALEPGPAEIVPPGGGAPTGGDTGGGGSGVMTGGFILGGVGAAGLLVGAITGGMAAGGKSSVDKLCPNKVCSTKEGKDKLNSTKTLATVSTVGLIAGGVMVAGGAVMVIVGATSKKKSSDKPTTGLQFVPSFGPTGGGGMLFGTF